MNIIRTKQTPLAAIAVVVGTLMSGGFTVRAQTDMQKLEQENQDLKKRLDAMEDAMKKEGIEPSPHFSPIY